MRFVEGNYAVVTTINNYIDSKLPSSHHGSLPACMYKEAMGLTMSGYWSA